MPFPTVTASYAGLFGLLFVVLSFWVTIRRARMNVLHGDAGLEVLNRPLRAHGNFAEYVPLILFTVALAEGVGVPPAGIHALLVPLLVARLLHPLGMLAPVGSTRQYVLRGAPALVTWFVLSAASAILLYETPSRIL